ncbi:26s protease regulatory subunit 4 [Blastocystis sp. ATCC 50177/Nand II]|uniref:26s protease regulatory subunit 4 n=1 Tax=Blastocystis sp. subtype 1 (strain ATCC 50177 / NandII) TaxID=478820 RepID=A0A196SHC7_BLAHN|nr:26s protease regulatory subunit 4 [Blastocystis sp. ATCC 50177/Nand II]
MEEEPNQPIEKKEEEKKKRLNDANDSEDEDEKTDSRSERAIKALKKNRNGSGLANKIPTVTPATKCKLRLLQLQRVYDYLQVENAYIKNRTEAKKEDGLPEARLLSPSSLVGKRAHHRIHPRIASHHQHCRGDRGRRPRHHQHPGYSGVPRGRRVVRGQRPPRARRLRARELAESMFVVGIVQENTNSSVDVMRVEKAPVETYADIGGLDEQIMEIKESVELPLTHPELFDEIGVKPPKGVILYGEPGTGKTLLAKAVANKTSATFLRLVGSELIQKYAGEGPKLVRDIFSTARDLAPSIVFIDEIDSIGTKRYDADSSGAREVQRTMLELLNQLDGFDDRGDVKVIMATNRIETLDPALLRPGRIDRKIKLPLPDAESKRRIFNIHKSKMSLDKDVNLDSFIQAKDDLSGADIRSICMEAGMMALKERRMKVNMNDFEEAKKKTLFRKKSKEPEGLYL